MSLARNIGKHATKVTKKISNKYSQKVVDGSINSEATKVVIDAIKTASKRAIQKTEATRDLVGNKISDAITLKKSPKALSSKELHSKQANNEIPKERYISPKERQQIFTN